MFEILQDWNKEIPTSVDHFFAILATAFVFLFVIGLYGAILFLGEFEKLDAEKEGGE